MTSVGLLLCAVCKDWLADCRDVHGLIVCPGETCVLAAEMYHTAVDQPAAAAAAVETKTKAGKKGLFLLARRESRVRRATEVKDPWRKVIELDVRELDNCTSVVRLSDQGGKAPDFVVTLPAVVHYALFFDILNCTLLEVAAWMELENHAVRDPITGKLYNAARARRCALAQSSLRLPTDLQRICAIMAIEDMAAVAAATTFQSV